MEASEIREAIRGAVSILSGLSRPYYPMLEREYGRSRSSRSLRRGSSSPRTRVRLTRRRQRPGWVPPGNIPSEAGLRTTKLATASLDTGGSTGPTIRIGGEEDDGEVPWG
ncbi:unnamed protein product [Discosporangium mesarthrocarpum]